MGNYDFKSPQGRLYQILAYRILNPLIRLYNLTPTRVKFHRDVSSNKDLSCPGEFVDEAVVVAMIRKFVIK